MADVPDENCTKACKTCPFLKANFGKPNPEGWNPDKANGGHDWYSQENAARIWAEGLRNGELLICHATDAESPNYGNTNKPKPGNERVCTGATALLRKTLNRLEQVNFKFRGYNPGAKYPVNRYQAGAIVSTLAFYMGKAKLLQPLLDDTTGVPWKDDVLNSPKGRL